MALRTRQEFAEDCKTTTAVITTNISRGYVSTVPNDKKKIDDESPLNKIFKKKYLQIAKEKEQSVSKPKEKEVLISKPKKRITKAEADAKKKEFIQAESFKDAIKIVQDDLGLSDEEIEQIYTEPETLVSQVAREKQNEEEEEDLNWKQRKTIADALIAERKAELAQLAVDKQSGNLMPVDLVDALFVANIQDIFKTFENETVNLASIYCDILAGGNREMLAEIIAELRVRLTEVIKRIEESSQAQMENIIDEYAEVRYRGEKK